LGVADILGPEGGRWDHAVVMRRMPAERSLATLVTEDAVPDETIVALAGLLAAFHEAAGRGEDVDRAATADAVRGLWEENLGELSALDAAALDAAGLDASRIDEIADLATTYLEACAPLFDERLRAGAARDGHGDLQAADIFCLEDGPRVLDCI